MGQYLHRAVHNPVKTGGIDSGVGYGLRIGIVNVFRFIVVRLQMTQTSDNTTFSDEIDRGGDGLKSSLAKGVEVGRDHDEVGLGDCVPRMPSACSATSAFVRKCRCQESKR